MATAQNLYAWATGYDIALLSLTTITTITASGDALPFKEPACRGYYDPGSDRVRTDGISIFPGYGFSKLVWAAMTWNQYQYIYTTLLGNAYSGPVTVLMRVNAADAYSRMDAVFWLPPPIKTDGKWYAPKKVECELRRLRTAA